MTFEHDLSSAFGRTVGLDLFTFARSEMKIRYNINSLLMKCFFETFLMSLQCNNSWMNYDKCMAYATTNKPVYYPDLDAGFCRSDGQLENVPTTFDTAEACVSPVLSLC